MKLSPEFLEHAHKMRSGNYYHTRLIILACRDILTGFRDLDEAEGYAQVFADRDLACFDIWGYPITSTMIIEAIAIVRAYEWEVLA